MKDWVIYINEESLNFSKSFKSQLSKQLLRSFETLVEQEKILDRFFFSLFIDEITLKENQDYIYTTIGLIFPNSSIRNITIGWKSDFFENKKDISKNLKENDFIEFFFFDDLPIDEIKKIVYNKTPF